MTNTGDTGTWSRYVRAVTRDMFNKDIAERLGVSESTIGNWLDAKNMTRPDPWKVREFALKFRRPVPEALIAAGFDESDFAALASVPMEELLHRADTRELIEELKGRIEWKNPERDRPAPKRPAEKKQRKPRFSPRPDRDPL